MKVPAAGAEVELAVPRRGGGLDAGLGLDGPQQFGLRRGVGDVVAVERAGAVAHDHHAVYDDGRHVHPGERDAPPLRPGLAVDADHITFVGTPDDEIFEYRGGSVDAALLSAVTAV